MKEIPLEEFVRRVRRLLTHDSMLAFFLGAGASISSGIPGAGRLADRWVHELYETEAGKLGTFEAWRSERCPGFDTDNPAGSYSTAMRRLFPTQAERQEEIERIVRGHDPGFAYATLSQLLAHETFGQRCNVVLTTNFDDLVADALYLFTRTRPLVVTHEALAAYAAVGRARPTVIKLHGDAMFRPRNTQEELAALAPQFVEALQSHLRSRALIMIGYGGNDEGVHAALSALPRDTITHGVYWVNDILPETPLGSWLRSHPEAFWVRHLDFDELMSVVKTEFDLPNPDEERFKQLMHRYRSTFSDLQERVTGDGDVPDLVADSIEKVSRRFGDWFSVELEAQKYQKSDPERAAGIYEEGIRELPASAPLLGNYALFLTDVKHDQDRSQELYERAISADPNHANNLGLYATFLKEVRLDYARAGDLYERAIAAGPKDANNLANYAGLLYARGERERARSLAQRAASESQQLENAVQFQLEIGFYKVANDDDLSRDQRRAVFEALRAALARGDRSRGWDFSANIRRARELKLPDEELKMLEVLAAVINDEAPLTKLDLPEAWPNSPDW